VKRERWAMLASILRAILALEEGGREPRGTTIAEMARTPYDRFMDTYLPELVSHDLVKVEGRVLRITEKGRSYLASHDAFREALERLGFE